MNKEQFWALFRQGAQGGQQGAMNAFEQQKAAERAQSAQIADENKIRLSKELNRPHEMEMENVAKQNAAIAKQNADTNELYRGMLAKNAEEEAKNKKLEMLFGKGFLGAPGQTTPGGVEAKKALGLINAARQSVNRTEDLSYKNPMSAMAARVFPESMLWGTAKEIADSSSTSREALTNVATGASATPTQTKSFQSWVQPGIGDLLFGKKGKSSEVVQDTLNTLQGSYMGQGKSSQVSPELLKQMGVADDPMVQAALQHREQSELAQSQQTLEQLTPEEKNSVVFAMGNPNDPKSADIIKNVERKYGPVVSKALNTSQATPSQQRTVVKRQRNSKGQERIIYSDGTIEMK